MKEEQRIRGKYAAMIMQQDAEIKRLQANIVEMEELRKDNATLKSDYRRLNEKHVQMVKDNAEWKKKYYEAMKRAQHFEEVVNKLRSSNSTDDNSAKSMKIASMQEKYNQLEKKYEELKEKYDEEKLKNASLRNECVEQPGQKRRRHSSNSDPQRSEKEQKSRSKSSRLSKQTSEVKSRSSSSDERRKKSKTSEFHYETPPSSVASQISDDTGSTGDRSPSSDVSMSMLSTKGTVIDATCIQPITPPKSDADSNEYVYECINCDMCFKEQSELTSHKRTCTVPIIYDSDVEQKETKNNKAEIVVDSEVCEYEGCFEIFLTAEGFLAHKREHEMQNRANDMPLV